MCAQTLGAVLVLGSAMFAALAQVFVRKLVQIETTAAIVFYFSVSATVLSMLTIPYGWVMPVGAGSCDAGGGGAVGRCRADLADLGLPVRRRLGDRAVRICVDAAGDRRRGISSSTRCPTLTMLGGAMLVILAGVMIIWREHQLGLEREKQRRAMTPGG